MYYIVISNIVFLFFSFNWRLITILWWFLPYIDMNQPWVFSTNSSSKGNIYVAFNTKDEFLPFLNFSLKSQLFCSLAFHSSFPRKLKLLLIFCWQLYMLDALC